MVGDSLQAGSLAAFEVNRQRGESRDGGHPGVAEELPPLL